MRSSKQLPSRAALWPNWCLHDLTVRSILRYAEIVQPSIGTAPQQRSLSTDLEDVQGQDYGVHIFI
jgi:hypothetical protein